MTLPAFWRGMGVAALISMASAMGNPSPAALAAPYPAGVIDRVTVCTPLLRYYYAGSYVHCLDNLSGGYRIPFTWPQVYTSSIHVDMYDHAIHDVRLLVWTYWNEFTSVNPHYKEFHAKSTLALPLTAIMSTKELARVDNVAVTASVDGWPLQTLWFYTPNFKPESAR